MITILINPFMSCGAKLLIYLVLQPFSQVAADDPISYIFYRILIALLVRKIFSRTLFKGETTIL